MAGSLDPPLRSDAERNRETILRAAGDAFATEGPDVSINEIARRAGVGVATVYRRFPDRDALLEAVFDTKMQRYADFAEHCGERALREPWEAFRDYVLFMVREQAADPAFSEILIAPLRGSHVFAAQHRRALRHATRLIARAKAAGVLRPGFDHSDLYLLSLATSGLVANARSTAAPAAERLAAYLLEGFGRGSATLPPIPRPWSRAARGASRAMPPT